MIKITKIGKKTIINTQKIMKSISKQTINIILIIKKTSIIII